MVARLQRKKSHLQEIISHVITRNMNTKKILSIFLAVSIFALPASMNFADQLDELNQETEKLWRRGCGAEDGAFTASASSMTAWGIGIGAAVALLSILIQSSSAHSQHSN